MLAGPSVCVALGEGRWSVVGPPGVRSGWARRAGRRVGLTVARFRVSADSAVESVLTQNFRT